MNLSILTKPFVAGKPQFPGQGPKSEFRDTIKITETFSDNAVLQNDNQFDIVTLQVTTSTCVRRLFWFGTAEGRIRKIRP